MDMQAAAPRSRTVTWQDPLALSRAAQGSSGLEFLRRIAAKELPPPPIAETLDYQLLEVSEGRAVFGIVPAEFHYNPIGTVHGGIACTLLDSVMGCAVHSVLPAGVGYTTLELKVNLVKAIGRDSGPLRAVGTLVHAGRTTAIAEGRIVDAHDRLYAVATTTCLILQPKKA